MVSLYPQRVDAFRRYVHLFDEMIAQDLNDLFDCVEDIQAEMGANPAGNVGTIHHRLFGVRNIGDVARGWARVTWRGDRASGGLQFRRDGQGVEIALPLNRFRNGPENVFGEDVPGCFGALQWPLGPGVGGLGPEGYGGVPWRHMITVVDRESQRVYWVGMDGYGEELGPVNSAPCTWGFVLWGLFT